MHSPALHISTSANSFEITFLVSGILVISLSASFGEYNQHQNMRASFITPPNKHVFYYAKEGIPIVRVTV